MQSASSPLPAASQDFWLGRRVFVTGGSGFLGTTLVSRLVRGGAQVVCLQHQPLSAERIACFPELRRATWVHGDLHDQPFLEQLLDGHGIGTIFHLAAQTIVGVANRDPIATFRTNIEGTWSLLEAARRTPHVGQVVVASSDKAYGDQQQLPYNDDTTPLGGMHPYDVSKACADMIARTYAATFGMCLAVTRCGNFYGPGDLNWNRIVPGTIRSILQRQAPVIRSDGLMVRDYFHVEDGAAATMLLAERLAVDPELRGQAFNFSNEIALNVLDLVQRILDCMGSDLKPIVRNEASNEIREQFLSARKAQRMLNWTPIHTLDEGLRSTCQWYRDYLAELAPGRPNSITARTLGLLSNAFWFPMAELAAIV